MYIRITRKTKRNPHDAEHGVHGVYMCPNPLWPLRTDRDLVDGSGLGRFEELLGGYCTLWFHQTWLAGKSTI